MRRTAKCQHCNKKQYPDELELHAAACSLSQHLKHLEKKQRRAWFKSHVEVLGPSNLKDKIAQALEDKVAKG
jgi:acetyl-CoA carboxylase beta subunit